MSQKELTVKDCFTVGNNLAIFFANADSIPGTLHFDLKEYQYGVDEHTKRANEVQDELKKKYPFKWDNADREQWKLLTQDDPTRLPKRIFDGSSADDGADDKTRASRAKIDEENFTEQWDKILAKKKMVIFSKIERENFDGVSGHASVIDCMFRALKFFREEGKEDKQKD